MAESRRASRRAAGRARKGSSDGRGKSNGDSSDGSDFRALLSAVASPEEVKPAVLKDLYQVLLQLASNARWSVEYVSGSRDFYFKICHDGIELTFRDVRELSNVLFKELDERFEQLFSNLCGISAREGIGERSSGSDLFNAFEVTILLFRCCFLLLVLLNPRQTLILEKGGILFGILRRLSLPNVVENTRERAFVFKKSIFCECAPSNNGCSASSMEDFTASLQFFEPGNPLHFFASTMIEVFVDELLVHGQLREYFKIINSVSSTNEILFNTNSSQGDMGIVMEAISNHFILACSDVQAFGDFLNQLFCMHAKELMQPFGAPVMGITSAISLFLSPVTASAPKYMQAHLFSLVSEAIDIKSFKPDRKLTNCFLSTFEKSVVLYMRHMSLQTEVYSTGTRDFISNSSCNITHPLFEFYLLPETKRKVDSLVAKFDTTADQILHDCCLKMKSDLVSSSMRFVKECQNIYGTSCTDEVLAILSCLVLKASECYDDEALRPIKGTSLQHIYLLASLLRVMSISLIQAIRCLRHSDDICSPKTLKDFSACKEYDLIMGVIVCFRDLDTSLPLQKVLSSVISDHSTQDRDSKMMFLHFSGLMSLSFASGLDCLVKACLLTILALLNLFVFEEGSLDALQSFVDSNRVPFSSELPIVRLQETVVDQNTSIVVASKFQKIRSLYSSATKNKCNGIEAMSSQASASAAVHMEAVSVFEEETEETSNGEIFLRCMLRTEGNVKDFDNLASFIECKQGKDYAAWLKNRQKYRKWRSEKMAVLRWKKKKKTWKPLKMNRN